MKKIILFLILLSSQVFSYDYPSVPNTFIPGTIIASDAVNANFSSLVTAFSSSTYKFAPAEIYSGSTRILTASGNITATSLTSYGGLLVSGNVIITGTLNSNGGSVVSGNILTKGYISASGNILTKGYLSVSGNILTKGYISASGNILTKGYLSVSGNILTKGHLSVSGNIFTNGTLASTGNIRTSGRLISSIANGIAPLSVVSSTVVPSLNADLLDGHQWSEIATVPTMNYSLSGQMSATSFIIPSSSVTEFLANKNYLSSLGYNGNLYLATYEGSASHLRIYSGSTLIRDVYVGTTGGTSKQPVFYRGNYYTPGIQAYSFGDPTSQPINRYDKDGNLLSSIAASDSVGGVTVFEVYKDKLYYGSRGSTAYPNLSAVLISYDSTSSTTVWVGSVGDYIQQMKSFAGKLYFLTYDGSFYSYDGSNPVLIADVDDTGTSSSGMIVHNGKLYFTAHLGTVSGIYSYDGTNIANVTNIYPGEVTGLASYNDRIIWNAGGYTYAYNGSSSVTLNYTANSLNGNPGVCNGSLYFGALTGSNGDVYVYTDKTSIVKDSQSFINEQPNNWAGISSFEKDVSVSGNLTVLGTISGAIKDTGPSANMNLKMKVVNIGLWDMQAATVNTVTIFTGFYANKICGIQVVIINDAETISGDLTIGESLGSASGYSTVGNTGGPDKTNISMTRTAAGVYNSAAYNSTSINRGRITVWYFE